MRNQSGFSGKNLALTEIAYYYLDTEEALRKHFNGSGVSSDPNFVGFTPQEVLKIRLEEHDYSCSLTILAALEASLRVDYLERVSRKLKDGVSREFRELYKQKERRVSLDEEILNTWRDVGGADRTVIDDLKGAFKYRHWLAHGRYWVPKLPRKYDYPGLYTLAVEVFAALDLLPE